ncbi:MAG: hypothetical protein JO257_31765, partial [Deltaproteobacteria bacterium]|nr:hypothetical protein [Deltaproteobacteria bacterium]
AGQTVRVVATSAQLAPAQGVAQDIVVALGTVTLGPLSAATTYAPQPVNVPASLGSPAVAVGTVGPGNLAVIFPTLVGPADATRVVLTSSGQQGPALETSTVVVDGPVGSTVDASHMLPIPHIETADADGAAWSIPASRAQPNLVEVDATYGELQWTIFAPTSATRVSLPALPMSVALTRPIAPPSKTVLRYFEMPRAVLTVDELAGSWDGLTAPRRADHQPIAVSSTASF